MKAESRPEITPDTKILLITMNHSNAGLFAQVTFALNQIRYCETHGYLPVVWFGEDSIDGPNAFFDPSIGDNVWDYYFEPVAGYTYGDIKARIDDPSDFLSNAQITRLTPEQLSYLHEHDPDSIYNYPYGYYKKVRIDEAWYERQRNKAHDVISRYVRVKPDIATDVESFVGGNFVGHPVLGIHLRGTDKGTANANRKLMRIVPPAEYFPFIDSYIDEKSSARIFVATDQVQFLKEIKSRYSERVIHYEAMRAEGSVNVFQMEGNNYRKGREVLIDALLLSRCDFLLKCTSAVGEYAMYFNPELRCRDLNHEGRSPLWMSLPWIKFTKRRRSRLGRGNG